MASPGLLCSSFLIPYCACRSINEKASIKTSSTSYFPKLTRPVTLQSPEEGVWPTAIGKSLTLHEGQAFNPIRAKRFDKPPHFG
jgi:ribosomal protein S19